jgi:hypothetical protein
MVKIITKERLGSIGENKFGSVMEVVEYNNSLNVWVKFLEHGNLVNVGWHQFLRGSIKNVYDKSVYGIGYIGEGNYGVTINGITTKIYNSWKSMLMRCYNVKYLNKFPTYVKCSVIDEWHNFQNFAKWYDENYYEITGERMCLDKDILIKGNKIYSPKTCIFVPERINNFFLKSDAARGELPIGVRLQKNTCRYSAMCSKEDGKSAQLKYCNTPEEAFYIYKNYKEELIKQIAEDFKGEIPKKLYDILINYKVEITD